MTPIWIEAQDSPPWTARLYASVPIAPVWIGAIIAILYLLCASIFLSATGVGIQGSAVEGRSFWQTPGWWTIVVNAIMIGFAPTVMAYTLRTTESDVRDLAPALGDSPAEIPDRVREITRLNPWNLRFWGVATALVMIGITYLDPGLWTTRQRPFSEALFNPFVVWFFAQQAMLGWLWSRAIVADMTIARAFSGLADRLENVDLLDLRPLGSFARRGVRSVFYWMVALVVFSLFWLAPNAGRMNFVTFLLLVAIAGTNLTRLLRGARLGIRREKRAQLDRLRAVIRSDQKALLESGGTEASRAAARLPALLASEARVAAVREWPFDSPTAFRFVLYVTLGVGSWVGGALVERLLSAAFE